VTGGGALGVVTGLLAEAGSGILEGGTVAVYVAQGFIVGAINGAIIGALSAYYGGGIWTGGKVGGALAAGMWFAQMLLTGTIAGTPAPIVAAEVLVMALAGAAMGALVGGVVEPISPARHWGTLPRRHQRDALAAGAGMGYNGSVSRYYSYPARVGATEL